MKKLSTLFFSLCLLTQGIVQAGECHSCKHSSSHLQVGQVAPNFVTKAVVNGAIVDKFSLADLKGHYVVLFFYPLDFTFVCPTEIHAFQDLLLAFTSRDTYIIGCSVDSAFTHLAWVNTPRGAGGIEGVTYPLISDLDKSISRSYNVLNEKEGIAYRGLFVLDREGIIRHQLVNDLPIGRNIEETLRFIDALQTHEHQGEVCPANWKKGDRTMKTTTEDLIDYFK